MAFQKIDELEHPISALDDRVAGRAQWLKEYFDANPTQLMNAFNALVDALNASGAAAELGGVLFGNDAVKHLRRDAQGILETSSDGETWNATTIGHVVLDADGDPVPQRPYMQILGASVTDDGATTIVGLGGASVSVNGHLGPTIVLEASDVGAVSLGNDGARYIRLNADQMIEASSDGQNWVVTVPTITVNGKQGPDITLVPSDIGAPDTASVNAALALKLDASKVSMGTADPSGGSNGDIYFKYEV